MWYIFTSNSRRASEETNYFDDFVNHPDVINHPAIPFLTRQDGQIKDAVRRQGNIRRQLSAFVGSPATVII